MATRTSFAAALLAVAFLGLVAAVPQVASAQMVPRLVSYPRAGTVVTPCSIDPQSSLSNRRTIQYDRSGWSETVAIFRDPNCSSASTLFTIRIGGSYAGATPTQAVAYRSVTPSPIGAAYLQQHCGQYAWSAGVMQNVTAESCGSLAALPARL
jgi:hypothetical protein